MENKKKDKMHNAIFAIGVILMVISPLISIIIDYKNGETGFEWDWEQGKVLGMYMVLMVLIAERLFKKN